MKAVIEEQDSSVVAPILGGPGDVLTCRITYPEARAALASARRAGRLDHVGAANARMDLEAAWSRLVLVEVRPDVAQLCGELVDLHALRGCDAVHLAAAVATDPGCAFVTWDRRLWDAARALGFSVLPRELPGA
jgi:predicted nucleic acid-binding protein